MLTVWERFESAAVALARTGTLKDRLHFAYQNHLAGIDESELPKEIREDFLVVARALHREPASRGEDPVRASIRKLSPEEADGLAASIVRMYGVIAQPSVATFRAPAMPAPLTTPAAHELPADAGPARIAV